MITNAIVIDIVGHGIGSFVVGFLVGFLTVHLKKLFDTVL